MGDDGHTASLFPNSPNLAEALKPDGTRRCWPMLAPTVPHQRLTMSRALLATANYTVLSISGSSKLTTLSAALASNDVAAMPIRAFLQPTLEILLVPMSQGSAAMKSPQSTVSMADKVALIDSLCAKARILPVITIAREQDILPLADALAAGGLTALE
ncbi:6-phosphogluconolactonase, partial [Pseudomonas sp. SST3]|uniref:6-phosphogluconolactonase n=1 Tax=Pseudomonas sp. SST3 TaxID=2267882 RepID=UPI00237C1BBA